MLKSLGVQNFMSSLSGTRRDRSDDTIPTPAPTAAGIEALTQMERRHGTRRLPTSMTSAFDEVVAHATRPFVASH